MELVLVSAKAPNTTQNESEVSDHTHSFELSDPNSSLQENDINLAQYEEIKRRATNISSGDYFKQDSRSSSSAGFDKMKSQVLVRYAELDEAFSDFNFQAFIKMFVYHFLYFCLLGPFVIPVISLFDSLTLAKNMELYPLSRVSFLQFWLYIASFMSLIFLIVAKQDELSLASALGILSSLIFRCSVVALKYAFINKEKLNIIKRYYVPYEVRVQDQIMPNWIDQLPDKVYKELRESAKRHEIDDALFFFGFFSDEVNENSLKIEEAEKFIQGKLANDGINCNHGEDCIQGQTIKGKYHGLSLLYLLIQGYNRSLSFQLKISFLVSLFLAAALFFIPYLIEVDPNFHIEFSVKFSDLDSYEIAGLCTSLFPAIFFLMLDFYFLFFLIIDSRRVSCVMKSLTTMVTIKGVQKHKCQEAQLLINFLDVMSIKTWSYVRRVIIDYGINFRKRIEYAAVVFTVFSLLIAIYLFAIFLFAQQVPHPLITVLVAVRLILLMIILSVNFLVSAEVNNSYLYQKAACKEIKNTINYLRKFKSYYFESQAKNDSLFIFAQKIQKEYAIQLERTPNKTLDEYMEELEDTLKDVMYEIEFDSNYNAFKVVGVRAEINLYKKIVLAVVSFILSSVVKFLLYNR